jgi:hypothetical protein
VRRPLASWTRWDKAWYIVLQPLVSQCVSMWWCSIVHICPPTTTKYAPHFWQRFRQNCSVRLSTEVFVVEMQTGLPMCRRSCPKPHRLRVCDLLQRRNFISIMHPNHVIASISSRNKCAVSSVMSMISQLESRCFFANVTLLALCC